MFRLIVQILHDRYLIKERKEKYTDVDSSFRHSFDRLGFRSTNCRLPIAMRKVSSFLIEKKKKLVGLRTKVSRCSCFVFQSLSSDPGF